MSGPRPRRLAAVVATVAVLLGGCTEAPPEPAPQPKDPGTPLASYDTTAVAVDRAPFCDRVEPSAVEEALDRPAKQTKSYDNGDALTLPDGEKDVAHEYGCAWVARRVTARAWVFAPPVTPGRARALVRTAVTTGGCPVQERGPAFGRPSVARVCRTPDLAEASYRGLFGDAWLSCSVSLRGVDDLDLLDRAGRWCVAVAEAARIAP